VYGSNVVVSEGEEWKETRKIVAPAFSEVSPFPLLNKLKQTFLCLV